MEIKCVKMHLGVMFLSIEILNTIAVVLFVSSTNVDIRSLIVENTGVD